MPRTLLIASDNRHKERELSELLPESLFTLATPTQDIPVDEDGESYFSNAAKKAEAYFRRFKKPVVSDDSGLNVDALPGELGVRTARFGGEGLDDQARARLLVEKMEGVADRSACFVCVLYFYINPNEAFFFEGRMEGRISTAYTGAHGFGYDPVFIPKKHDGEQSIAELPEWKKENSHRALACRKAASFFQSYLHSHLN